MKFSWLVLSCLVLFACEDSGNTKNDNEAVENSLFDNVTRKTSIVRDINLLPLGDARVLGAANASPSDVSLSIVTNSAHIANLVDITSGRLAKPSSPEYLERIAWVVNAPEFKSYLNADASYQKYRTIKRTDEQTLLLARLPSQQLNQDTSFARTDLLLLNSANEVSDGLTVYYELKQRSSSIAQAFHIDDNQQIWLKGYSADAQGVELQYSATFVILPSGKIRKIMSEW